MGPLDEKTFSIGSLGVSECSLTEERRIMPGISLY